MVASARISGRLQADKAWSFRQCPSSSISSQDSRYTITMGDLSASATLANGQGYSLQAAPAGGQVGESCGTLSLNSLGSKGAASGTVSNCWR